jgi:hypothetical protein
MGSRVQWGQFERESSPYSQLMIVLTHLPPCLFVALPRHLAMWSPLYLDPPASSWSEGAGQVRRWQQRWEGAGGDERLRMGDEKTQLGWLHWMEINETFDERGSEDKVRDNK